MHYKIAQFILTPLRRGQSIWEIYLAQPDANKEALAGKLFALIEIESAKAAGLKIINFLINTLNQNYYQNEKMILRERVKTIKVEHIFESTLAKTNKKLAEFLTIEKIKFNFNILNLTVGVIYNDDLHFTNLGKNKALLIYKNKTSKINEYKLADITEQADINENRKPTNAAKLFSNVISGNLPRGGCLIFASEALTEYLSAKQITNIVTTLPPASAAEQIKNTLGQINAYVPFLGIIIKNTAGLETLEIKNKQPITTTKASVENLLVTEEKTKKLLTPSGLISAKGWPSLLNNLVSRWLPGRANPSNQRIFWLKDKIFAQKKVGRLSFKKVSTGLKNFSIYLASLFIYIFKIFTDKRTLTDFFRNLVPKIKNFWIKSQATGSKLSFWYRNLSKINRVLFSIFLACLTVFSLSLAWQGIKNRQVEKQTAITNLLATIEQKQNQIDASLLYDNEEGAAKLITEAEELLKQWPQNSQSQKNQYQKLAAKYQVQMEKISRVVRVSPVEMANFVNLNPLARPKNIILADGKIYAADAAQSAIYSIDVKNKLITSINLNGQKPRQLDFPSLDKNNNIYYLNSNNLTVLDTKSEKLSTSLKINYNGDLNKAIDLKQYNNRFYLSDRDVDQIYRFNRSGNELTSPSGWLNVKEKLTDAVGLDIDGDIYLLKTNGEILKYTKGKKQNFASPIIKPAISQASKFAISKEEKYIYILEAEGKRLIVLDKGGKFNCQYLADQLDNPQDFQVDEKNKKIYFLDNAAVYSIEASHLNKK
jgi:DNA-binding beta-propeller fold protein YncE